MATLNKSVLGKVTGQLGDIVFRQRNGKNYISMSPKTPIASSPAQLRRMRFFKLCAQLSKAIYADADLVNIWKIYSPVNLSAFNYMIKINYPCVEENNLSDLVKLTPEVGFGINATSVNIAETGISAEIAAIGNTTDVDPVIEKKVQLVSVLYLNNPLDEAMEKNAFITSVSEKQDLILDTALTFNNTYSSQQQLIYNNYQNRKGFLILLTFDEDNVAVNFSNTFLV